MPACSRETGGLYRVWRCHGHGTQGGRVIDWGWPGDVLLSNTAGFPCRGARTLCFTGGRVVDGGLRRAFHLDVAMLQKLLYVFIV